MLFADPEKQSGKLDKQSDNNLDIINENFKNSKIYKKYRKKRLDKIL